MKEAGDSPGWTRAVRNTSFFSRSGLRCPESRDGERCQGEKKGVKGEKELSEVFIQSPVILLTRPRVLLNVTRRQSSV